MRRSDLLDIFDAGIIAADGRLAVRARLAADRPPGPLHLIATGKAAVAMTLGALDVLGDDVAEGFVVCPAGHGEDRLAAIPRLRVAVSSHPVPDARSVKAGEELLAWIGGLPGGTPVLALISGGSSSLVEVLPADTGPDVLARLNRWLLGSGLDIFGMNAVRRRLSRIKDGGLAAALWGRRVLALYLSDVRGDDPAWIGSGLLSQAEAPLPPGLPEWVRDLAAGRPRTETSSVHVEHAVVGSLRTALAGCEAEARALGHQVILHRDWLDGPVDRVAERILADLDEGPPALHLWGGEPSVQLPAAPGRGGRCQHLALCCATLIAGRRDVAVLCGATDGTDGNTEDAGALVDGGTIRRGRDAGLDPTGCLEGANSAEFLAAAGDLIYTGPTGTNVNDLVVGLRVPPG